VTAARDEHIADRPSWNCRVCTMPWPCRTARAELSVEFREFPSMLIIHLYGLMGEAADDLQTMDGLPARFLGWVSPAFTITST
jgi:hypothetical protein